MTIQRIDETTRYRDHSTAPWPWMALIPFVATGVLITGMLTGPPVHGDGPPGTGVSNRCPVDLHATSTLRQHFTDSRPDILLADSSLRRVLDNRWIGPCVTAPSAGTPVAGPLPTFDLASNQRR